MDKKLSDNEIVKALDNDCLCVVYGVDCESCPLREKDCKILPEAIKDLIHRLQSENKELRTESDKMVAEHLAFVELSKKADEQQKAEIAELKAQCSKSSYMDSWKNKFFKANEEIERLTEENKNLLIKVWNYERPARTPLYSSESMVNCNLVTCYNENADLKSKNAELQKQADELKEQRDVFKKLYESANESSLTPDKIINTMNSFYREQAEHLAGLLIEQAVKDAAPLAIQRFINQLYIDHIIMYNDLENEMLKTKSFVLKRYYGLEVE